MRLYPYENIMIIRISLFKRIVWDVKVRKNGNTYIKN